MADRQTDRQTDRHSMQCFFLATQRVTFSTRASKLTTLAVAWMTTVPVRYNYIYAGKVRAISMQVRYVYWLFIGHLLSTPHSFC